MTVDGRPRRAVVEKGAQMHWKQMSLDRAASFELLNTLNPGGLAHSLIRLRNKNLQEADPADRLLDVQLRRSWVSLYVGLTTVLDLHVTKTGYRLKAHETWREFAPNLPWSTFLTQQQLTARWGEVDAYLSKVISEVPQRRRGAHIIEGRVHAAICSGVSNDYRVINRETSHTFKDIGIKERICAPISDSIYSAVEEHSNTEKWWPGVRYNQKDKRSKKLGTSPDVLAVENDGRLLVIEAKPANALDGIAWGPAQVSFYAQLFALWIENAYRTHQGLQQMLEQRKVLGLTPDGGGEIESSSQIVPVLAIGPGEMRPSALKRSLEVASVLNQASQKVPTSPIEIWKLDEYGSIVARERP